MDNDVEFLPQDIDFLGFLQNKLRDLRGLATLTYELIQNADDVHLEDGTPGATCITFDVRDDALIVENDGHFRPRDFDRLQTIASGEKREEEGTTGSFGIGFISVYQITDNPEVFSSGKHWRFRPEAPLTERIEQRATDLHGTRFRLPWAFDPDSALRRSLRLEPVDRVELPRVVNEMSQALALAAPFLKQLKTLELRRAGETVRRIERSVDGDDRVVLLDGGRPQTWRLLRGGFPEEEKVLRQQFGNVIESKRHSHVQILVSDQPLDTGRLFAVLPSDTSIPLPFYVNADFYPTTDRKSILFESDYQSAWNRAAITSAARLLRDHFDELPALMGAVALWRLLQKLDDCRRAPQPDSVFAEFWNALAPTLPSRNIVLTAGGTWVKPREARLLESPAEEDVAPILESLGIHTVHSDLRPQFGLLRHADIGVALLSAQDLADAFTRIELKSGMPLTDARAPLNARNVWVRLWAAMDALLTRRQSSQMKVGAERVLAAAPIALSEQGRLYPPRGIRRADATTRALFSNVAWLQPTLPEDIVPARFTPLFTAEQGLAWLARSSAKDMAKDYDPAHLYAWFESRKSEILPNPDLVHGLRELPMWPASGELRPLTNLYLAGGFDDHLDLAELVDVAALGGRTEFLKDLHVEELDFHRYVTLLVPRVFAASATLPVDKQRALVRELAFDFGRLVDNASAHAALAPLPLVECTDGRFYQADHTYTTSEVRQVLGDDVLIAALPRDNSASVLRLYEWLGARSTPRPADLIGRVDQFVVARPTPAALQGVRLIFEHLAAVWPRLPESERARYRRLQTLAWLPAAGNTGQWYTPDRIYAVFQNYLFGTQAAFLAFSRVAQSEAGRVGLLEFLKINTRPEPWHVIDHLLHCCRAAPPIPINREVYRFLNDNADQAGIVKLRDEACLLLPGDHYVRPDQVYWSEHPFGRFRSRLGPDFRSYSALLERLGVREEPDLQDYIRVLLDVSEESSHNPLDDDALGVVMACWRALGVALENGDLTDAQLTPLKNARVVPDRRIMLSLPATMFFEDRPGLAVKFKGFLDNNVIARPVGAWRAMEAVGVQLLGAAVEINLLECDDSRASPLLADRMTERRELLERIIVAEQVSSGEALNRDVLDRLSFGRAGRLVVSYTVKVFRRDFATEPETVPALLLRRSDELITVFEDGRPPWAAFARELAYALKPVGEVGGFAGGLKEALQADDFQAAVRVLDELGYPPIAHAPSAPAGSHEPVAGFGGADKPSSEPDLPKPPLQPSSDDVPEEGNLDTAEPPTDNSGGGQSEGVEPAADKLDVDDADRKPDGDELEKDDTGPDQPVRSKPVAGETIPKGSGGHEKDADRTDNEPDGPEVDVTETDDKAGGRKSGADDEDKGKRKKKGKSRGKLRTYVTPDGEDDDDSATNPELAARRKAVDDAGVALVMAYENRYDRSPILMVHHNEGYDILVTSPNDEAWYIEVKSMAGDWSEHSPAGLTKAEYERARQEGEGYWLYVVAYALGDDEPPHLYRLRNPALRVSQYLYDDGWIALTEPEEPLP